VTRADQAASIAAAGADFIGLNLWPGSRRHVTAELAADLATAARGAGPAKLVGVFVDAGAGDIAAAVARVGFDIVQLHGNESPDAVAEIAKRTGVPVWKAVPAAAGLDLAAWGSAAVLLDTPTPDRGGSGHTFDWSIAKAARAAHPALAIVLAGGLDPSNVAAAITAVSPWAVDVASGVESAAGIKDLGRVAAFLAAARGRGS
jgi:phosphoribosylanthranilate isomerase